MGARTGVGALGLVLLAILVFLAVSSWSRQPAVAKPSIQPITFPHSLHVQTYKIDCQYCHSDARRSEYAGLPSVARCMGCHKIAGAALPEVKKLAEYYARGEPIPWVRVNKLPEFTYFPHKAHLRANVKCQTCHGPVETMTTFGAVTGCQRTTETILPLVVPNEQIVPGVAAWFATVCRECPAGCGVIARNREGRVVKLEGNPDHPVNQGALCARGQAALQGLYHPDRFAGPRLRDGATLKPVPWDVAQKVVVDKLT